jgi:hypothetical protein
MGRSPSAVEGREDRRYPTSHHVIWLDLDGDGRKELVNVPLVGANSVAPTNEVVVYTGSGSGWRRRVIFDRIANGHDVATADLNGDGRDDIITNDNARGFTPANPAGPARRRARLLRRTRRLPASGGTSRSRPAGG